MLHVVFIQGVSEDLRSNVKAIKNARRKAGAEKSQAEDQKLKQVDWLKLAHYKSQISQRFDSIALIHLLLLSENSPVSSGFVCGAPNKGHGGSDAADSDV